LENNIAATGTQTVAKNLPDLTAIQARVLGTLMEKARTVPDSYPLTLNSLILGCNQKNSRFPSMELSEADVFNALNAMKSIAISVNSMRAVSSPSATRLV
jgi:uncharacterized protein YceH (UPF0502 family)